MIGTKYLTEIVDPVYWMVGKRSNSAEAEERSTVERLEVIIQA